MRVSWSRIKSWRRCKNQHFYRYEMRIVPKRPAVPLFRGRILGDALDARAEGRDFEEVLAKYEAEYKKLFIEEREFYGDLIGDCRAILQRYCKTYKHEKLKYLPDPKTGKPYELKVEFELFDDVLFIGYIDKMAKDKQGRLWVMDHKSHKQIPDEGDRFLDLQLVTYVWAAPLAGLPKPDGVLWDYIRTKPPSVPPLLKNGELSKAAKIDTDYETYMAAIKDNGLKVSDYKDMLKSLEGAEAKFFKRVPLPHPNKELVKNMVSDLTTTAHEIKHLGDVDRVRSMDRMCKSCSYFTICMAELRGLDSEFIRKHEYQSREEFDDASEETNNEDQ